MKKLAYALALTGVLFGVSVALHELLISVADGNNTWSPRAAATCSVCHGG